jgi:hypothetical protein
MAATITLDDPATPARLHELSMAIKEARYLDHIGHLQALSLKLERICSKIRDEMRDLDGRADPELLIALWRSAQISHAEGLEYAKTGKRANPDEAT